MSDVRDAASEVRLEPRDAAERAGANGLGRLIDLAAPQDVDRARGVAEQGVDRL